MFNGFLITNSPTYQFWDHSKPYSGTPRIALTDDCAPFQYVATGGSSNGATFYLPTNPPPGKQITFKFNYMGQTNSGTFTIYDSTVSTGILLYQCIILGQVTLTYIPQLTLVNATSTNNQVNSNWVITNTYAHADASSTNYFSTSGGLNSRSASAYSAVLGGQSNTASNSYSVVAGGTTNTAGGAYTVTVGGISNSVSTNWSVIVGGNTNAGGSTVAVTTQTLTIAGASATQYLSGVNAAVLQGYMFNSSSSGVLITSGTKTAGGIVTGTPATATGIIGNGAASPAAGTIFTPTGTVTGTYIAGQVLTGTGVTVGSYISAVNSATFTSTISTTTLSATWVSGTIAVGMILSGGSVTAGTYIVANLTGVGTTGASTWTLNQSATGTPTAGTSYTVSASQLVASTTITGTAYTVTLASSYTTVTPGGTVSFFRTASTLVGGGRNTSSGGFSFVGGGGDTATASEGNTASGDWSVIVGGAKNLASANLAVLVGGYGNTASGIASFVGGGGIYDDQLTSAPNIASGTSSVIVGGSGNSVTSSYGMILGGRGNTVNGGMAAVIGGAFGSTRGITGNTVFPGNYAALGNYSVTAVQAALLVIAKQTTDATPTVLTSDGGVASTTNQVVLQANSAYYFVGSVIAGVTGGGNTKAWTFDGAIKKGAANSIALVGTPTITSNYADAGASSWTIAITVNTTLDALTVTVTGQAATTIRWVCKIETTEMNF